MTPVGGEQVCSFILSVTQEYSSFDKVVLISGRVRRARSQGIADEQRLRKWLTNSMILATKIPKIECVESTTYGVIKYRVLGHQV